MRKNICFFFACLLFFTVAAPNAMAITDDKVQVYQDGALLEDGGESFILNGATYVPLRSACEALGATDVNWDAKNSTASVNAPGLSLSVQINSSYMVANGRYLYMEDGCKLMNGSRCV